MSKLDRIAIVDALIIAQAMSGKINGSLVRLHYDLAYMPEDLPPILIEDSIKCAKSILDALEAIQAKEAA
jgi:hypothetical protein